MDDLFSLKFNSDSGWGMANYHFHNDCEILFIVSGECECLAGTELIRLRRGTVLPLRETALHKTNQSAGGDYARYVLHFSPDDVASFSTPRTDLLRCFSDGGFIQLDEPAAVQMTVAFERCRGDGWGYGGDVRRRNAFFELLILLGEMSKAERLPQKVATKNFSRIHPILTYIKENPAEPLALDLIAEKFHFNKQYLCRIFKKTTGISVGEYITSVRVQRACRLLRQGRSVQRSGEEAGFNNNTAFVTTFGKFVGMSPGKYKKRFAGSLFVEAN